MENGENCFLDDDDLNLDEFSNIDSSLVLSLMGDARAEDAGDIESLEPEIVNGCSSSESSVSGDEYRFCEDEAESCSSTASPEYEWDDEMETMAYFVGEHQGLEDYSQVWYDEMMPMAMEEEYDYICLWQ